ncbi:MAG: hypothetical protein J6O51_07980, partial [Bacteroidales bacterium]|nr:hypothetical protein [Bacteroidales bacterium]
FYSISDYLVFFTRLCVTAEKYDIVIAALCLMPDHFHAGTITQNKKSLSGFWCETLSLNTKQNNSTCHRKGHLFNRRFGSSLKPDGKIARTNIIYIGNNPVERGLVNRAEQYRWNFLAYAKSDHPFSEKLILRKASRKMRKYIKEIEGAHRRGNPLSYESLQRMFSSLDQKERLQLIDFIVVTYSVIDYSFTEKLFGSIEDAIEAMHHNTGREYELKETFVGRSDAHYATITKYLLDRFQLHDIHDIFRFSEEKRRDLLLDIYNTFSIPPKQIAKFLRLKDGSVPVFHKTVGDR